MTTSAAPPDPGHWVRVRLPDGRAAMVTTRYRDGQRLVVVRPLTHRSK